MILLAALSSWLAMRKVAITPLGVARRSQAGRVSAVGPVIGLVLLVVWLTVGALAMNLGTAIGMAVFMGFMGAIFLIINLVGVWSISLMGRLMASMARTPQMMVAGRRMADDPRAVWRSFGAVALVGFLVGIMYPATSAISMSGDASDEVGRIVIGDINRGMLLTSRSLSPWVPCRPQSTSRSASSTPPTRCAPCPTWVPRAASWTAAVASRSRSPRSS